ncbi:Uncharacterised protein [Pantoea agglomerans]|uniref:Uncharacterized protein n=1 Tax=Enterobacter agglomerans TaxID=549 RepID=A0A379ABW8_ENTAG|nr:Uncharacterised protein [Pantoea agglomerans]
MPSRITGARVNHEVAWFVDDNNVFIFINDVEWQILRFPALRLLDLSVNRDQLAAQHFFFGCIDHDAVYSNATIEDPLFYART